MRVLIRPDWAGDFTMKRIRHTAEQIIRKLKTAEQLIAQGKNNLQAPWLGLTGFLIVSIMLSLLVFIGEAVRDALDPRKTFA